MIPQNQHLDLISSLSFPGSKPCPLLPFLKFTWFFKSKTFMNMFPQKSTIKPHFFSHYLFPQQQVSPSRPSADLWRFLDLLAFGNPLPGDVFFWMSVHQIGRDHLFTFRTFRPVVVFLNVLHQLFASLECSLTNCAPLMVWFHVLLQLWPLPCWKGAVSAES